MSADRTVVLVGKTGNGKSATGNSILGGGDPKPFKSKLCSGGVTATTEPKKNKLSDGRIMTVIDTPGLFDLSGLDLGTEIVKCLNFAPEGIHAVLIVLSLRTRFSIEEKDAVRYILELFGSKISDHMIVVLTGGDELEASEETIEDYIGPDGPEPLKDILEMCGNKYVVFDNRTEDPSKITKQRNQLLSHIEDLLRRNGGKRYTQDLLKKDKGDDETRNLVLVGRTGNGKSATGNSILGAKKFKSKISAVGVTTTCAKETVRAGGHTINVIDTPGYYDFSGDIIDCMKGLEKDDGIHAVLVVLSLKNRFTKEEMNAVSFLTTCFSDKISDYMIVVITGGDELEDNDETIDTLLDHDCPEPLKEILEKCGNRYVVMDNRTKDTGKKDKQLQELYRLVEKVFVDNGRKPFMEDIIQTEQILQINQSISKKKEMGDTPKLILVGRTGNGKSATCNSILRQNKFKSKNSAVGVTTTSTKDTTILEDGRIINVIDTPDKSVHIKYMAADRTVVLVGRTGNGKSATGNSILGKEVFQSKLSSIGVTTACSIERTYLEDVRILNVIDTPGLFDFSRGPQYLKNEISKCFEIAKDGGVHALLVVLSLSKGFSEEEKNAVAYLIQFFGDKIKDYMIIVFTGGDQLEANDESIEDFIIRDCYEQQKVMPTQLQEILRMCDTKYVVFNNMTNDKGKKADQRNKLISLVDEVSNINKQTPITMDMFRQVKKRTEQYNAGTSPTVSGLDTHPMSLYGEQPRTSNPIRTSNPNPMIRRTSNPNPMMRNLILVGRTGNGKSATGNSILGRKEFKSKVSAVGVTTTCATGTIPLEDGRIINVIDTPGFYDFSGDPESIQEEIINCMMGLKEDDAIHAVLVVLSLKNPFTKEEKDAVSFLKACFSDNISHYMIVVITGGDELEDNDETIDTLLDHDCPEPLKDILKICGGRYVVMNNKATGVAMDTQLVELFRLVEKVFDDNDKKPYMDDVTQMNLEEINQFRRNASMEKEPPEYMQPNSTKYPKRREAEDPSRRGEKKPGTFNKFITKHFLDK